mgnify:CR=1 FL=1
MSLLTAIVDIVVALIQLVFAVALALFSITVAINILNRVTKDVNEFEEIRKKNLAVAYMLFGTFVAISLVVSQGVSFLSEPIASALASLLS